MSALRRWAAFLVVLGVLAVDAQAHLMSRGHATLNVVKDKAYIVVSVPITVFAFSKAGTAVIDGVLTSQELKANEPAFRAAIRAGLKVTVGDRQVPFSTILINLPKGEHHAPGQADELTAMIVAPLGKATDGIRVTNGLWGEHAQQLKVRATVSEGRRTVRSEVFELTPKAPQHRFFAP